MDTLENIGNGLMWVIFGSAAIVMMIDLLFNHPGIFLLVILAVATFVVIARSNRNLWNWLFHYDPYDQPSLSFF